MELPACPLEFVPDFLKEEKRDVVVYYCLGQAHRHLSNRLLAMPLRRTRIIGVQLYRTGVQGLLRWGYNSMAPPLANVRSTFMKSMMRTETSLADIPLSFILPRTATPMIPSTLK